jgi:hypothetical protein
MKNQVVEVRRGLKELIIRLTEKLEGFWLKSLLVEVVAAAVALAEVRWR